MTASSGTGELGEATRCELTSPTARSDYRKTNHIKGIYMNTRQIGWRQNQQLDLQTQGYAIAKELIDHGVIEFVPRPTPSTAHMLADAVERMVAPLPKRDPQFTLLSACCGAESVSPERQICPQCGDHTTFERKVME